MKSNLSPENPPDALPIIGRVPRLNSLLHRLQTARDPDGQPLPWLDELMAFLEDPPPGTTDRWKHGAAMCREWGLHTTGPSVYRLYQSHVLEWRFRLAYEADPTAETLKTLREKAEHLIALRTVELLSSPRLSPTQLTGLARADTRRRVHEFAVEKSEAEANGRYYRAREEEIRLKVMDEWRSNNLPMVAKWMVSMAEIFGPKSHVDGTERAKSSSHPPDPFDSLVFQPALPKSQKSC